MRHPLLPLALILASCNGDKDTATDTAPAAEADADADADADTDTDTDADTDADMQGSWDFGSDTVTVTASEDADGLRTYTLSTTQALRDGHAQQRSFSEQDGDPLLRSGVLLTDALFSMAVEEARELSVSQVSDGAFESPQDCDCYQTGAKWTWVWTRDIAYAIELGLAWLDPERSANSLRFKLASPKPSVGGGGLQIVQDTGTGGSWPVSTDRVAWVRGAMAVLRYHDDQGFRDDVIEALRNTAETDRRYAWDARDGLYRGETSFLDWREQTYPAWTAENNVHIGMSKSLSTNLDHLYLLRSLEALTGEAHGADDLAAAIDATFWDGAVYRSYTMTELDPAPVQRQDLLATSFAVMDLGTHPEALAAYPFGAHGPPVVWPQQQLTPIYHNRAIWPFVTAYAVIAGRTADNGAVVSAGLDSLIRGAALNLSHMENLELEQGLPWRDDGDYSGPVVNSRRQLWSVAGFLGAVAHGVFGIDGDGSTISADPRRPDGDWFTEGATLDIGGQTFTLGGAAFGAGGMTTFATGEWTDLYGAQTPAVSLEGSGGSVTLTISGEADASFDVWRDGVLVAEGVSSPWTDPEVQAASACYTAVARLTLPSQPSEPVCWWGDGYRHIQSAYADTFSASGGSWSTNHGRGHYENWGAPADTLTAQVTAGYTGEHYVQLVYGNGSGGFSTGITAAVKWVTVSAEDGSLVAEGPIVMPQLSDWGRWADSSFLPVSLEASEVYTIQISDGWNMSYLDHYEQYVGGNGGGSAPYNYVNVSELKLLFMR